MQLGEVWEQGASRLRETPRLVYYMVSESRRRNGDGERHKRKAGAVKNRERKCHIELLGFETNPRHMTKHGLGLYDGMVRLDIRPARIKLKLGYGLMPHNVR